MSESLALSVLEDLPMTNIFSELNSHMTDTSVTESQVFMLLKAVIKNYLKNRVHHLAKRMNQNLVRNDRVRQRLTNLIQQKGQFVSSCLLRQTRYWEIVSSKGNVNILGNLFPLSLPIFWVST